MKITAAALLLLVTMGRATPVYGPTRFYDDVSIGSWVAISNFSYNLTSAGSYTNESTTYTNYYRVCATNRRGRLPVSSNIVATFVGNTNDSNSVNISWTRYDGIRNYVIERSYDAGSTWTNWITATANSTNWVDDGSETNWSTNIFTNAYALIAAPVVPWGTTGDVASLQAQITSNDTDITSLQAQVTSNDTDIATLQTGKLSLTGGTLTGALTISASSNQIALRAGELHDDNAGTVYLRNLDHVTPYNFSAGDATLTSAWVGDGGGVGIDANDKARLLFFDAATDYVQLKDGNFDIYGTLTVRDASSNTICTITATNLVFGTNTFEVGGDGSITLSGAASLSIGGSTGITNILADGTTAASNTATLYTGKAVEDAIQARAPGGGGGGDLTDVTNRTGSIYAVANSSGPQPGAGPTTGEVATAMLGQWPNLDTNATDDLTAEADTFQSVINRDGAATNVGDMVYAPGAVVTGAQDHAATTGRFDVILLGGTEISGTTTTTNRWPLIVPTIPFTNRIPASSAFGESNSIWTVSANCGWGCTTANLCKIAATNMFGTYTVLAADLVISSSTYTNRTLAGQYVSADELLLWQFEGLLASNLWLDVTGGED